MAGTTVASQASDPIGAFKSRMRETWALGNFGDIATFTLQPAGHLVRYAGVKSGQSVLDIGTGTGVVAVAAARLGARVTGLDLTPELLEQARANASVAQVQVQWQEGDAEALPYPDASFDVVLSQFGHMFAPRPEVATAEMLRVLKPGGRIAFATWPPEQLIGRMFAIHASYVPPPVPVPPPIQWGDPNVVRQRLGDNVAGLHFERGTMAWNALSPQHFRLLQETKAGPFMRIVAALQAEPARLQRMRAEIDALASEYLVDNVVRCEYLLTRATKR